MTVLIRLIAILTVVTLAVPGVAVSAQAADDAKCAGLAAQSPTGLTISEAVLVPAAAAVPAYCRVSGETAPHIRFQMRLPTTAWNGKFYQAGCGGFCGDFDADKAGYSNTIGEAVKRGYAAIVTDNGHRGYLGDASWAVNNEEALAVFAETGIPLAHDTGTKIVQAFYGRAPKRSYFAGCSNGGRMALMAAQRYPKMFDGILAGAPVLHLTHNGGLYGTWILQKNIAADGSLIIGPDFNAKLGRLHAEVLRQCTAVTDPQHVVITDSRACTFDAKKLPHCAPAQNTPDCFTDAERGTVAAFYAGPSNTKGQRLYTGTPLGSEPYWPVWLTGTPRSRAVGMDLGRDYLKMAFAPNEPNPPRDAKSFDFDRDPPRLAARAGAFDATDPNLAPFQKAGGKMIMYQGWADPVVLPERTVTYSEDAAKAAGGLDNLQRFVRLFMIAGAGHCWEMPSPGPDQFDPIAALENWVERGKAPESIPIAQVAKDGTVQRRASLRPYPLLEAFEPQ